MARINITLETEILHGLFSKDGKDDAFAKLLETILNQVLEAQSTEQIGAAPYERTDERTGHRNGFRERDMTYYLRIVKIIYFDEPAERFDAMDGEVRLVAYASGAFTVLFVLFANPLIELAAQAAKSLY